MSLEWRPGRPKSSWNCCRFKEVLVIVVLNAVVAGLFGDLSHAFFRSTVDCTHLVPDEAGKCDEGFSVVDGHCQPKPSDAWSGSQHCPDRNYVMNKGVHLAGRMRMVGLIGHFIALFVMGPLIDTWGRKPVIMVTLLGDTLNIWCFALVASMVSANPKTLKLLPLTVFLAGATNAFNPAVSAMVSDLCQATVAGRAKSFSLLKVTSHSAATVAIALGFWLLGLRLTNYFWVWAILGAATVLSWFLGCALLPQSLPSDISSSSLILEGDSSPSDRKETHRKSAVCRRCWKMMKEVGRLVRNDHFLLNFIIVQFFRVAAFGIAEAVVRPFLMSHLGYSQSVASLVGVVLNASVMTGNATSNVLIRRSGALLVYGTFTAVVGLGFGISGLAGLVPCDDTIDTLRDDAVFWSGMVLAGLGFGVTDTAGTVLLSLRVHPEAMGVMFSLEHGLGLAGHLVGVFMGTRYLFDARAEGWRKSWAFSVSSVFLFFGTVWYFAAYYLLEAYEDNETEDDESNELSNSDSQELSYEDSSE